MKIHGFRFMHDIHIRYFDEVKAYQGVRARSLSLHLLSLLQHRQLPQMFPFLYRVDKI